MAGVSSNESRRALCQARTRALSCVRRLRCPVAWAAFVGAVLHPVVPVNLSAIANSARGRYTYTMEHLLKTYYPTFPEETLVLAQGIRWALCTTRVVKDPFGGSGAIKRALLSLKVGPLVVVDADACPNKRNVSFPGLDVMNPEKNAAFFLSGGRAANYVFSPPFSFAFLTLAWFSRLATDFVAVLGPSDLLTVSDEEGRHRLEWWEGRAHAGRAVRFPCTVPRNSVGDLWWYVVFRTGKRMKLLLDEEWVAHLQGGALTRAATGASS